MSDYAQRMARMRQLAGMQLGESVSPPKEEKIIARFVEAAEICQGIFDKEPEMANRVADFVEVLQYEMRQLKSLLNSKWIDLEEIDLELSRYVEDNPDSPWEDEIENLSKIVREVQKYVEWLEDIESGRGLESSLDDALTGLRYSARTFPAKQLKRLDADVAKMKQLPKKSS